MVFSPFAVTDRGVNNATVRWCAATCKLKSLSSHCACPVVCWAVEFHMGKKSPQYERTHWVTAIYRSSRPSPVPFPVSRLHRVWVAWKISRAESWVINTVITKRKVSEHFCKSSETTLGCRNKVTSVAAAAPQSVAAITREETLRKKKGNEEEGMRRIKGEETDCSRVSEPFQAPRLIAALSSCLTPAFCVVQLMDNMMGPPVICV